MNTSMLLARAILLLAMTTRWLRMLEYGKPLADEIDEFIAEAQIHVGAVKI